MCCASLPDATSWRLFVLLLFLFFFTSPKVKVDMDEYRRPLPAKFT